MAKQTKNKISQGKKKTTTAIVSHDELSRLIQIILAIVVIVVVFYIITVFVTKHISNSKYDYSNHNPAVLQYDEIILGSLLKAPRDEYYVLAIQDKDPYEGVYTTYMQLYSEMENPLKIYTSPLNSVFNARYIATESSLIVENVEDLRIKESTLFYIKDHKIVAAYEGKDNIAAQFAQMIK